MAKVISKVNQLNQISNQTVEENKISNAIKELKQIINNKLLIR